MLKRKYRLPAGVKFIHASPYKSRSFRLMITKNDLSFSRFGFIASKKVDKSSVVRNRIKRVARSCIQDLQEKIIDKYDMLFILQKNSVGQSHDAMCREIENVLKEKRIINDTMSK